MYGLNYFVKPPKDAYIKLIDIYCLNEKYSRHIHNIPIGDKAWYNIIIHSSSISIWGDRNEYKDKNSLICKGAKVKDSEHYDRIIFAAALLNIKTSPILEAKIKKIKENNAK